MRPTPMCKIEVRNYIGRPFHPSNQFRLPDSPKFGEPIQNVTISVGRDAVFACVVDNLQTYKVINFLCLESLQ